MSAVGPVIGVIIGVFGVAMVACLYNAILVVREKQQVVLERCGRFRQVLLPGMHCILPFIDRPKRFSSRYYLESPTGAVQLIEKKNQTRVMTQDEIMCAIVERQCAHIGIGAQCVSMSILCSVLV